jgi:hypothetical protein
VAIMYGVLRTVPPSATLKLMNVGNTRSPSRPWLASGWDVRVESCSPVITTWLDDSRWDLGDEEPRISRQQKS